MSKKIQLIFIILGMLIMLVPFAGMIFRPTSVRRAIRYVSGTTATSIKVGTPRLMGCNIICLTAWK